MKRYVRPVVVIGRFVILGMSTGAWLLAFHLKPVYGIPSVLTVSLGPMVVFSGLSLLHRRLVKGTSSCPN
jgi:hypothetical protein